MVGDPLILDLSNVTRVSIDSVVNNLFSSVGKEDVIRAGHDLTVARFSVAKIVVRWLVFDGVIEAV